MQLYVSYIQPSFKLLVKVRGEVWVIRRYSPPALLCDRVLKHGETSAEVGGSSEKPGRTRPGGAVSPHQGGAVYDGSDILVSALNQSQGGMFIWEGSSGLWRTSSRLRGLLLRKRAFAFTGSESSSS